MINMTEQLAGQEFENLIQALAEAGKRYLGLWKYEEDSGQREVIDSLLSGLSDDELLKVSSTLNHRKEEWYKNPIRKPGEYPGNPYTPIVSILYPERAPGGS